MGKNAYQMSKNMVHNYVLVNTFCKLCFDANEKQVVGNLYTYTITNEQDLFVLSI